MVKKHATFTAEGDQVVKGNRRLTCKLCSFEEKNRIMLSGLCGEDSIAELCCKEG